MEIHRPSPEVIPFGLRALKMVALADGAFSPAERNLIETAQRTFGSSHDLAALAPITPAELAEVITEPGKRRQIVRGMIILSLVDGEASPAESAVVEAFAEALEVDTTSVDTLRLFADRSFLRARFDIARRFFAREKATEMAKEKGLLWLVKSLAVMAGVREDEKIAAPYRALEGAPEGSLGRGYFDFIRSNGYSLPGEKGSPPEPLFFHDLTHVLSGYGTDPEGELQVLSFHAGCRKEEKDPFAFVLFGIAEFHLGIAMSPVASGTKMMLDPAKMFAAIQRGAACTIDPTHGWDPWPVINEPLADLRARYGISPLA